MSCDEQPDGDIHGERAAESEMSELSAFEKWWAMLSKVPYMSKKEIAERAFYAGETASHELRFDACRPYLKEGETAADALARLSAADEWRPIATAPAHGVRVLATWDNTWSKGGEHIEVCEAGERGEWFYSFDCDSPATEPTHWMPLPAAPTTTED